MSAKTKHSSKKKSVSKKKTTSKRPSTNKKNASATAGKRPSATSGKPTRKHHTGTTRKRQSADSMMNIFVFTAAIFFILCGISLFDTTEYVELPQTEKVSYQVGDPKSFFDTLGPIAADYDKYGLYPSVMLAQAALESNYGESQLSLDYHNYFGIKAHGHHRSIRMETTEYYTESPTTITDNFCVYNNPNDCFKDYAELLTENDNYSDAVGAPSPAIAAKALQAGGYATDPNYASKLIQIINDYNLTRFDPMTRPRPKDASNVELPVDDSDFGSEG